MKALILAAGEAKRLRPITNNLPKCLLPIGDKRIIDYQMENLRQCGIFDIALVVGYHAEKIINHLTANHQDLTFTFIISEDYYKTYPAHGLWLAREHLDEEVLYLNADVICDPAIVKAIITDNRSSVTAIQKTAWDEEEVNIIVNGDMQIVEIGKHIAKSLSYGEFIGVTKIGKNFNLTLKTVLDDFIERNEFKKFAADALNLAIQRGETMYALDVSDKSAIEIDTKEDLDQAYQNVQTIYDT